ncbi:MAG: hypothetical protein ABI810_15845 [Sphingomonas bacterium]
MPSELSFIPIEQVVPIPAFKVLPGEIAFVSGHRFPMLRAETSNSTAIFVDLGGGNFMQISDVNNQDETSFVIADWRLEIDPTSLNEGKYQSYVFGQAYSMNGSFGLFALRQGQYSRPHVLAISTDGTEAPTEHDSARLFFSKWRIVSGPTDAPIVWAESADVAA